MKITKSDIFNAVSTALIILLISLFLCMLFAGENIFFKLLPIWLMIFGMVISIVWDMIKPLKEKKKLKLAVILILATAAGTIMMLI
ncbi:MAG: hypothetical protein IJ192_07625 [Clostridia bacterium]|nr:hypothetical protein [Clostridia bacterium]